MPRRLGYLAATALMLTIVAARPSAPRAPSYPIVCRGGPGLRVELRTWKRSLIDVGAGLALHFNRGTTSALGGVAPGTCAWQDRPVSATEPDLLCWSGVAYGQMQVDASTGSLDAFAVSTDDGESKVQVANHDGQFAGAVLRPGDRNQLMYFRAVSEPVDFRQCLHVTHTGP